MSDRRVFTVEDRSCRRHRSGALLLAPCTPQIGRLLRGVANEMPFHRPRLVLLGNADPALEALRLDIACRLHDVAAVLIDLDELCRVQPRHQALAWLRAIVPLCQARGTGAVLATARPGWIAMRLIGPALFRGPRDQAARRSAPGISPGDQPLLGRRRSTTSKPTISIPSGGAG